MRRNSPDLNSLQGKQEELVLEIDNLFVDFVGPLASLTLVDRCASK